MVSYPPKGVAGGGIEAEGAMKWRLNPASLQPSDTTVGRQHLVKFYQNAKVSLLVEPYEAHWQEL